MLIWTSGNVEIMERPPLPNIVSDLHGRWEGALDKFHELLDLFDYTRWTNSKDANPLAWHNGRWMMGYISMYLATGRAKYLRAVLYFAELLFKNRADLHGIKDVIRKRLVPAWSTAKYKVWLKGKWTYGQHCHCAHAGMILYPVAMALYLIRRDPLLYAAAREQVDNLLNLAIESVTAFDEDWVEFADGSANYNVIYRSNPSVYPHNCYAAMGRVFVALYLATGDDGWRIRAEKLARTLQNSFKEGKGAVLWPYHGVKGRWDDMSHGAIVAEFIFDCYRAGIVFKATDVTAVAQTLENCYKPGVGFSWLIDGTNGLDKNGKPKKEGRYGQAYSNVVAGWWLHYAYFNPKLAEMVSKVLDWTGDTCNLRTAALMAETCRDLEKFEPINGNGKTWITRR